MFYFNSNFCHKLERFFAFSLEPDRIIIASLVASMTIKMKVDNDSQMKRS